MNFFVSETTFLRYFIPLVLEGNKRGIQSILYWEASGKYNCPQKHINYLKTLSNQIGFRLEKYKGKVQDESPTFLIEGIGHQNFEGKKIALSTMMDFRGEGGLYDACINNVDHYIFPNKSWITHMPEMGDSIHGQAKPNKPKFLNNEKNLFLGSPKYDVELNKQKIIKKYNLSTEKKCFLFYPRHRDMHLIDIRQALKIIESLGYEILIKYREKEQCNLPTNENIRIFKDESWYPHTSMELICASDIVINTDSTGIKECVLLKKPVLNFKIKPFTNWLVFLYNEKFHVELERPFDYNLIKEKINFLKNVRPEDFEETIDKFLFSRNTSQRILDFLCL